MKTLLISDLQLESGVTLGSGEYGEGSRFHDQEGMLDAVLALAEKEKVSVVGVLGDVFEFRRPSPWAVIAFQSFLFGLIDLGIEVLIVRGNHDLKSETLPSSLSIFDKHVAVSITPGLYPLGDAVFCTLPWAPMATMVAKRKGTRNELHDLAAASLVHAAQFLRVRAAEEYPASKAVLLGHWAISGSSLPTGLSADALVEVVVPLSGLAGAGYDMAAFGHLHLPQVLSVNPPIVYCGSPWVCNWGEGETPHGVWIYDTEGAGEVRFESLPDRTFKTLNLGAITEDWRDGLNEARGAVPAGGQLRVRFEATEDQLRELALDELRQDLIAAGWQRVTFKPKIIRAERVARVANLDDTLTPEVAFQMWLDSQSIENQAVLLSAHADYLTRVHV